MGRRGWQAERINRRRNLGGEKKEEDRKRRGGHQGPATQLHSKPWRKNQRKVYRIEKDKSPEAKGSQDNLRKAGKKQAKPRPGIHN